MVLFIPGEGPNSIPDTAHFLVQELISDFFSNSCVEPFNIDADEGEPAGHTVFPGNRDGVGGSCWYHAVNREYFGQPLVRNLTRRCREYLATGETDLDFVRQVTFDALAIEFDFILLPVILAFRYVFS